MTATKGWYENSLTLPPPPYYYYYYYYYYSCPLERVTVYGSRRLGLILAMDT